MGEGECWTVMICYDEQKAALPLNLAGKRPKCRSQGAFLNLQNNNRSLTAGSLWRNIWETSWPMVAIMILNFLVGFTDVYVAGLINEKVQAAVGFVSQLYFFVIIFANAVSVGTLAMVARSAGAGDRARGIEVARHSLAFSMAAALGLTVLGLLFSREIISLAGFPEEIREIALDFFRIFCLALCPNYLLIISNAVFRASGELGRPLLTMTLVSILNIIGDFGLVFGIGPLPAMGYRGIAVATAASFAVGMTVNLLFFRSPAWRDLYRRPFRMSQGILGRIVRIGWPAGLLQVVWSAGSIVLYNILGRLGEQSVTAIASLTNGLRLEAVIYLPAFALNMAASVLVGQNLGAGKPERAGKVGWHIALSGVALVSAMALVTFLFAEQLASLLTTNPAVLEETARYLQYNMISEPFMALSAILGGGLQGAGDTRGTMRVIMVSMWGVRLPLAYFLALRLNLGAQGVWSAMVVSMCLQGVLMAWRFRKGHWKGIAVE